MVRLTTKSLVLLASFIGLAASYPVRREVPQEHSHEDILRATNILLKQNNPNGIQDAVFGLLGNAAASVGQGKITNTDCLQAATADQAFSNAKAAGDVEGMTNALLFRAIERNTGAVGQASAACTGFQFANPEIAAITQHQDPASQNAAAVNKAIVLELARQIDSIGGNPQDALRSGTFAPGQIGDPTAAGNTCDDPNDANGCINTLKRLVLDATPEEIDAAVAGNGGNAGGNAGGNNGGNAGGNDGGNNNAGNGGNAGNGAAAGGLAGKNQNVGQCQVAPGGGGAAPPADDGADEDDGADDEEEVDDGEEVVDEPAPTGGAVCPPAATVTVTAGAGATQAPAPTSTQAPPPASTTAAPPATGTGGAVGAPVNVGNIDFRKCTNPSITFGAGQDGRKATEFSFIPTDLTEFPHGSALNGQIIMQFTCDNLVNRCGFTNADQTVIDCRAAQASVANRQKDPASADIFNAALGFKSNFASIDVNAPQQSQLTSDADASGKPTFRNCAKPPTVIFAAGLEGRAATELTFKPENAEFEHGSAKNAQIIYQALCDTLVNKCGFTNADATVTKCRATQQSIASLGNVGKSADAWNLAVAGVTTTFAKVDNS